MHAKKCKCAICADGGSFDGAYARFGQKVRSDIRAFGRSVIGVFPNDDSKDPTNDAFVYTVGNSLTGKPELLLIGMFNEVGMSILNEVSDQMKTVADAREERAYDLGGKYPVLVVPASDDVKEEFMKGVRRHTDVVDFDVMQVVLCDPEGLYPWDAGCSFPYSLVKVHRRQTMKQ